MNQAEQSESLKTQLQNLILEFLKDAADKSDILYENDPEAKSKDGRIGFQVVRGRVLDLYIITSCYFEAVVCDGKVLLNGDGALTLGAIGDALGDQTFRIVQSRHVEFEEFEDLGIEDAPLTNLDDDQVIDLYRRLFF